MISLHCTCRRLRQSHSLTRSLTRSLTTTTTSDISSFINQVSTLEKSQQWSSISHALSSCSDPQAIAQHSLTLCAASIKGNSSQDELWSTDHTTLPPCTYGTLLHASVEAKNLDQLTILLGETRAEPAVAAAIGVGGLFNYYSPFIETNSTSAEDPMKRQALDSEIETRIVGHFQEWVGNMDQRATLTQSQLLFSHMHSLYKNDIEQMVNFIDKHFASGTSTESNALTTYELLTSIDEARATTFTLTAYDFLAAHDIVKATEFLKVVRERGNLDLASIKLNQYSDMVWRSIPLAWSPSSTNPDTDKTFKKQNKLKRQKQCFSPESVEVDVNLANYIARSSGMESPLDNDVTGHEIGEFQSNDVDFACIKNNLDNLFYLANGSSGFDMKLRHTFYKNLLNCNRPRTLLAYEQLRRKQESLFYSSNGEQGTPLSLDVEGYKCVIKAHANQLNAKGILKTLSDWNQTGRLISTSTVGNKLQTPFATPDSSVYKTVISIFYVHPHMITSKNLEKLFDQMQQDNVTPDETKDILALFKFANKAKSVPMTKTLLDWVDSMMESEVPASDSTTDTTISDFDTALINSVVPKRSFSKVDLVKMYDLALETNSAEIDNGDICLDILFTMKKHKIALNGNRVALVMKAFKNSKNFDAVLELFHSMSALKVKRDTYHVSLAVVAYVRTDQVAKGLALLNRFESAGQSLKTFAYFAAAFEIMRRLCVKPHFIPFPVTNSSGETEEMSQKEAMIKCIDLFLFAMENEELYAGSKNHLQTSIKLLDPFIYEEMIQYIEYRLVNDSESQPLDTASTTSLPPAPERLLKLFKELKKLANRNQTHR